MRKLLTLTLALALTLSLAACSGGNAPSSSTQPSSSEPVMESSKVEETSSPASTEEGTYKVEVKPIDDKKIAVVIGGASPTSEMVGTHWGVEFDKKYEVRLDVEEGFFDCASWKYTSESDMTRLSNMKFSIAEDALILYADFSNEAEFSFSSVKEVTLVVDDVADDKFNFDPITFARADVAVSEITLTKAPIDMPTTKDEGSNASSATPDSKPAESKPTVPASSSPYSGTYTGGKGTMIVTDTSITIDWNGTSYSIEDYVLKDNQGIMQLDFSSQGAEIRIIFTRDKKFAEVYVNQNGDMFTKGDKDNTTPSDTTATGNYSAMAGSYKGQSDDVLTISADSSFSFTSPKTGTITGTIPAGHKSGDKITAGEYEITLHYGSDYSGMSVDVRSADGKPVIGTDMVRS